MGSTYPMTDGSVITAAGVNALGMSLIGSDVGGNTSAGSYTQIGSTISVPATTVANHVVIVVDVTSETSFNSTDGTSASATNALKIVIDSTDKKEWTSLGKILGVQAYSGTHQGTNAFTTTLVYHYIPSAGEIAAGFDVKVYAKVTTTGSPGGSGTITANSIYVYGG